MTGHYLRLEAALAVARYFDLHLTKIALQRLRARPVARVATALAVGGMFLISQVMGQFGMHRTLH